jgi:2,3-bisphosphoglycerate-independent phosphoglycerate mutase
MADNLVLLILDGFGYRLDPSNNAIAQANTPTLDELFAKHPFSLLAASGPAVGLPEGQMGNSEVGHITIGAGRRVLQDLPKINQAFASASFAEMAAVLKIKELLSKGANLHLVGLISSGGVHSHIEHIIGVHNAFSQFKQQIFVHGITDGRDVLPKSALNYIKQLQENNIELSSISGRFYAMDRDNRWERTQSYYDMLVVANEQHCESFADYIELAYQQNIIDEFIVPAAKKGFAGIKDNDVVLLLNFRADRMRQLTNALANPAFDRFARIKAPNSKVFTMTSYADEFRPFTQVLFEDECPTNTLGEVIAKNNLSQLRIAETEKYAHVTYFFNGGLEELSLKEDRIVIPSPKVATYDQEPQMSVFKVAETIRQKMAEYNFLCINFANCDMVGHSGDIKATIAAVEAVDAALKIVLDKAQSLDYQVLITADHGNAEQMLDEKSGQPLTSHTLNPVPLIYYGNSKLSLKDGELADIAPTVLHLLGLSIPQEMTGKVLADD